MGTAGEINSYDDNYPESYHRVAKILQVTPYMVYAVDNLNNACAYINSEVQKKISLELDKLKEEINE